jgi:hypothetical protein
MLNIYRHISWTSGQPEECLFGMEPLPGRGQYDPSLTDWQTIMISLRGTGEAGSKWLLWL